MLTLQHIAVWRQKRPILQIHQLQLDPRQFTVILGHNGSGKSTLLRLIARQLKPDQGQIELNGQPLAQIKQRTLAKTLAFLPQSQPIVPQLTVRELVGMGRFPWRGLLARWQAEDHQIVAEALRATDTGHLAHCDSATLSGGERQRAWIAMLLAQQAPLLLLDEPTSALDPAHQYEVMHLLKRLNREEQRGVIAVLHDLNLATRFAERIVALKQGRILFDGPPAELLASQQLAALYDMPVDLLPSPSGLPFAMVRGPA